MLLFLPNMRISSQASRLCRSILEICASRPLRGPLVTVTLPPLDKPLAHLNGVGLAHDKCPKPVDFLVIQRQKLITGACEQTHQDGSLAQACIHILWIFRFQEQIPGKYQLLDRSPLARLALL